MFDTNKLSQTDWQRVDALTDDEIDTSDVPELDASFFASATWREPSQPPLVAIPVEPEVLEWFKSQGDEYEQHQYSQTRLEPGRRLENVQRAHVDEAGRSALSRATISNKVKG